MASQWRGDAVAAARFGSPAEIRSALLPEQQGDFDILTEQEPDEQREMLAARSEIRGTGNPRSGSTPWADLKTQLGL